jgi:hypothetical protein
MPQKRQTECLWSLITTSQITTSLITTSQICHTKIITVVLPQIITPIRSTNENIVTVITLETRIYYTVNCEKNQMYQEFCVYFLTKILNASLPRGVTFLLCRHFILRTHYMLSSASYFLSPFIRTKGLTCCWCSTAFLTCLFLYRYSYMMIVNEDLEGLQKKSILIL